MKAVIPLVIWMLLVVYASLSPVYDTSTYRFFNNEDKVAHVIMYMVMSFLMLRAIGHKTIINMFLAFLLASLFGFLMEILQERLDTGRLFDIFDIIANIFGAFVGTMLFYIPNWSIGRNQPPKT